MASVCFNPFDGDAHYDIDLTSEIDTQIYKATLALMASKDDNQNSEDF